MKISNWILKIFTYLEFQPINNTKLFNFSWFSGLFANFLTSYNSRDQFELINKANYKEFKYELIILLFSRKIRFSEFFFNFCCCYRGLLWFDLSKMSSKWILTPILELFLCFCWADKIFFIFCNIFWFLINYGTFF